MSIQNLWRSMEHVKSNTEGTNATTIHITHCQVREEGDCSRIVVVGRIIIGMCPDRHGGTTHHGRVRPWHQRTEEKYLVEIDQVKAYLMAVADSFQSKQFCWTQIIQHHSFFGARCIMSSVNWQNPLYFFPILKGRPS